MAKESIILNGECHVVTQCISCAVWHTVPEIVHEHHRLHGGFHSCPNGHQYGWKSGAERKEQDSIRQERDRLKQDAARLADEIAAERARAEAETKRAEDAEKKVVQIRRRAAAGVCPCCNRTFLNVQRHMKTKHANVIPLEQKQSA